MLTPSIGKSGGVDEDAPSRSAVQDLAASKRNETQEELTIE